MRFLRLATFDSVLIWSIFFAAKADFNLHVPYPAEV